MVTNAVRNYIGSVPTGVQVQILPVLRGSGGNSRRADSCFSRSWSSHLQTERFAMRPAEIINNSIRLTPKRSQARVAGSRPWVGEPSLAGFYDYRQV